MPRKILRVTPLAHIDDDAFLANLGWHLADPSHVLTRSLGLLPSTASTGHLRISAMSEPQPYWINGFAAASSLPPDHLDVFRKTLDLIPSSIVSGYLSLVETSSGTCVAYGQAVEAGGIVGLYNIVVLPSSRGKGYGRIITQALLDWGAKAGADSAYLQVTEANEKAISLYRSMGFEQAYRYHYRIAPGDV
jgi:ribosomal protein S18 acetylase RimI-like enzyme